MLLIFLPILAMLALEFVIPGRQKLSLKMFFLILGGGFLLWLGVRSLVPTFWVYPEGEAVMRARGQVAHLLQTKDWQKKPVIILEGSSATAFGINGGLLEKDLAHQGLSTTVLQFSLSGANHFERLFMLRVFLEELGAKHRKELQQAPTILLSEVFDAYDTSPLYLFTKESYSQRAIAWSYPDNIWTAWKAWRQHYEKEEAFTWPLMEHLLLNRFAVGLFSSMQPFNYRKKEDGFFPLSGTKKTFQYDVAKKNFEKEEDAPSMTKEQPSLVGWSSYYQKLQQQLGGVIYPVGFYALPTLELQRRSYQQAFLSLKPSSTVMMGPAPSSKMKRFLHKDLWFDGVHPQGKGSIMMTEWLADQILQKWPELLAAVKKRER